MKRKQEGQVLVFVALVLLFLVPLIFAMVEIGARIQRGHELDIALSETTRSVVQSFRYQKFAANGQELQSQYQVAALANQLLLINLRNVSGLAKSPYEIAQLVHWEIYPNGGTCADGVVSPSGVPLVCATLDAPMHSLTGVGDWTRHSEASAVIDQLR